MKLSLSSLAVSLLAGPWAAGVTARSTAVCNADNCLRAIRNPTQTAAATSFCQSYTQATVTATTSLPPQFATACGSGPAQLSRLSSACSCHVPAASCSDTTSDSNNCGSCGNVCVPGSTCSSSACVCTNSGKPPCNGQCLDLTSDDNNCGTCGNACASGTTCQSGACAPVPATCPSYTASCSDVVEGILESNSIASPELVDYRIQSALLGITTPSDFLAALGPDPCQQFTDPDEYSSCVELLANPQFVSQLTDLTTDFLGSFQTCASDYAMGAPDYQIIIDAPANGSCPGSTNARRHEIRTADFAEYYDLTPSMLEGIEYYRSTADAPVLGRPKSSGPSLIRKQQSTCSQTGQCFERCPDCRNEQTYCGSQATVITTAVCGSLAAVINAGVAVTAAGVCGSVCGPAAPLCAAFCARAAGGLSAVAVVTTCAVARSAICDPLTQRCANCNSANNGICNEGSSQCCAGETGTSCGADCCCCPRCYAPGGINCACTAAPC